MKLSHTLLPLAALVAAPASAATLFDQPASTGITASPGSKTYTFNAGGGTGTVSFNLEGYLSLDGAGNGYDDLFTVKLNGTTLSSGYFNLGGGGSNLVVTGTAPTSVVNYGFFNGGLATFSIGNAALLSGLNTLTFSYASASPQGTGDEGWGLNSVLVTGASAGVPEPATWALMILGFGAVGGAMRRRSTAKVRFA